MIYCKKVLTDSYTTTVFLQMKLRIYIKNLVLKVSFSIFKGHFYT